MLNLCLNHIAVNSKTNIDKKDIRISENLNVCWFSVHRYSEMKLIICALLFVFARNNQWVEGRSTNSAVNITANECRGLGDYVSKRFFSHVNCIQLKMYAVQLLFDLQVLIFSRIN